MKLFGDKETFAIEFISVDQGAIQSNVFVSGQNITPIDNRHYDQFFIHGALESTADFFIERINWFKYEQELQGDCIHEIFINLWESEFWEYYSVFDWAPCTSEYRCAVIPYIDKIYLCCSKYASSDAVSASNILPFYIARDIIAAREYIVSQSKNPYLKLENT